MPSLLTSLGRLSVFGVLWALPGSSFGAGAFSREGDEYPIATQLAGDQVRPSASVGRSGGWLVWQDNATDGDGAGISARRLGSGFLGNLGVFRVNEEGNGEQENPKVSLLSNGGAVFVWQGGTAGKQDIYARFVSSAGTFLTGDLRVNTESNDQQVTPAVAAAEDGNVLVVWSSYGQDGSMQGIFGQWLSDSGSKVGGEFRINQFTAFNQRNPVAASLGGKGVVVSWVSEQQRFENSVDVFGRLIGRVGEGSSDEFLINNSANICASPSLVPTAEGGFGAAWSERALGAGAEGWHIAYRHFDGSGSPSGPQVKLNRAATGQHFGPVGSRIGENLMFVWTSVGQDGSREGVFGSLFDIEGAARGNEIQVNTYGGGPQIQPCIASDPAGGLLVVWSSFVGGRTSFDLFGQRYGLNVIQPPAPFVAALSSSRLSVTWPESGDANVAGFQLAMNENGQSIPVSRNVYVASGLNPSQEYSFRVAYVYKSGERSVWSDLGKGRTWGSDENLDGLPDDWQKQHWGGASGNWGSPTGDDDGDGATNLQEFMAGTNPKDSGSVLSTTISLTGQGAFLRWNTQPGFVYQVEMKAEVAGEWVELGSARFAAGEADSVLLPSANESVYYRVKRLR